MSNFSNNTNNVKMQSKSRSRAKEVLEYVSIPMYFYSIIIPKMGNYYDTYMPDFDVKPKACCPLHDEDTPSFNYYPETESFHCFGCGVGGPDSTVINLHMLFSSRMTGERITYDDAVSFLYNYFVKGNELTPLTGNKEFTHIIKPGEIVSTNANLIKYYLYKTDIEKSLGCDKEIEFSSKELIWKSIDTMDMLLKKRKIEASEALKYIKEKVDSIKSRIGE